MKTTTITVLSGFALVIAAQAGTPITTPAPAPSAGLWEWFVGGSVGYLTDFDQEIYSLQAGVEYQAPGARGTHAIYLQAGFTQDDFSDKYTPPVGTTGGRTEKAELDLDIIPITLNYKYEAELAGRLKYYVGLGAGIAILDSSYDWRWSQALLPPNNQGEGSDDRTDVRVYGELFAGLSYQFCEAFEVYGGVRYILMDDIDQDSELSHISDYSEGLNNDLLIELGVRIHF